VESRLELIKYLRRSQTLSPSPKLSQPFQPTTNIRFVFGFFLSFERGQSELFIYDLLGHEVATLVNEQLKPLMIEFDGSSFASGVYFFS
jgi:hypothetical protein